MIPVNEPDLTGKEGVYLQECIRGGWISSDGPFVTRLEREMADRLQRTHALAVSNGTAALELACSVLDLKPGDEVLMPTLTIISCAAAVVRAGGIPVVVDADATTWNMDVHGLAAHVTSRTKAIMAVHLYGLATDMAPIFTLAREHGLTVVEDAAEAVGQTWMGQPCGGLGDLSTLSFYANKHVTSGEGGMVLTNDAGLARMLASRRNLCFIPERRFVHHELGWNYRMSNLQAAVAVAQLERLDEFTARKRAMGQRYRNLLAGLAGIHIAPDSTAWCQNNYWVFGVVLDDAVDFDAAVAMERLASMDVQTRPFFFPIHEQPVFVNQGMFTGVRRPVAERLARRGFYLPSGMALTASHQEQVAEAMWKVMR